MSKQNKYATTEKIIFLIVIGLNLIPVFSGKFFPTMDGGSHLNNVTLIKELLFNSNTILKDYFIFNPEPVPNWMGHFILLFFKLFLPSFLAEKALLLIYFIGFPLAFRALIKTISPENIIYSYLIFPFTYSSVFLLGFYNFSLAIIFFLLTLTYWIKQSNKPFTIKSYIFLFLLMIATYFSHIFMFALLLFSLGLHVLTTSFFEKIENNISFKSFFSVIIKKGTTILICSFIPLVLFVFYVISRPVLEVKNYIATEELIAWIKNIRPIIAYNPPLEEAFTTKIFYILSSLFIIAIYLKADNFFKSLHSPNDSHKVWWKSIITAIDFWLLCFGLVLALYFIMPDSDNSGGFFSIRLGLVFFILLILWISTQNISKWFSILSLVIVLFMHFQLNIYYASVIKDLDKQAQDCYQAAEFIEPNSTVLSLNYSNHWLMGHFSNYLGADKPMVILENYEATKGYFPLLWNEEKYPNMLLAGKIFEETKCLWWKSSPQNSIKNIDYVFVLGNSYGNEDACVQENVLLKFKKVYQGSGCALFKANQ